MKNKILITIATLLMFSCSKNDPTPDQKPEDKTYQINIPEMVSFIGKPYSEIEGKFGTQTVKANLGDKQIETFGEKKGAPIGFYSIKITEKNAKITTISVQASMAGHDKNRNELKYWDDNLSLSISDRIPIDASGSPKPFWSGSKDQFYTYLRDNPDFGGWLQYSRVSILSGQKNQNLFEIVIE